jgi:hypothetical protein
LITQILSITISDTYISSAWKTENFPLTKDWLIGFAEAEGSFYITKKDKDRYVHAFGITQKKDRIVLEAIVKELNITTNIRDNLKGFSGFDVLDSVSLQKVKRYFTKRLKGIKSLDFKIWAKSFRDKGKHDKLAKVQTHLQTIRENPSKIKFKYICNPIKA